MAVLYVPHRELLRPVRKPPLQPGGASCQTDWLEPIYTEVPRLLGRVAASKNHSTVSVTVPVAVVEPEAPVTVMV